MAILIEADGLVHLCFNYPEVPNEEAVLALEEYEAPDDARCSCK